MNSLTDININAFFVGIQTIDKENDGNKFLRKI
jgi:hypothetical protein